MVRFSRLASVALGVGLVAGVPVGAGAAPGTVEVASNVFRPGEVQVNAGESVTWTLVDGVHDVAATDGSFKSAYLSSPGQTFSHTFSTPGTYAYGCTLHPPMTGSVVVLAAAAPSPTPTPTPKPTPAPTTAPPPSPTPTPAPAPTTAPPPSPTPTPAPTAAPVAEPSPAAEETTTAEPSPTVSESPTVTESSTPTEEPSTASPTPSETTATPTVSPVAADEPASGSRWPLVVLLALALVVAGGGGALVWRSRHA